MSTSPAPETASKSPMKRRRAFVACVECRKRKIKCVTLSDDDDRPCTRCALKNIQCEFQPISEHDSSSSRPVPSVHGAQHWDTQPPTPHSAGLYPPSYGGYDTNAGINQQYPHGARSPYPYQSNAWPANATPRHPQQRPPPSSLPYGASPGLGGSMPMHPQNFGASSNANPNYYGAAQYPHAPSSGPISNFYDHNNGQASGFDSGNTAYQWPQMPAPRQCTCPPGPCFCGANFN
ncbi:hypothetical protein C8R43DRAFT_1159992 [Mycena crocata]|nr:hypothetical protein C8R43DRAFT_1159992 [Mycena crocata]